MAAKNDITLDVIATKAVTPAYAENYDKIDFSPATETIRLAEDTELTHRYLKVTPEAFSFASMNFYHPDHNLMLTFKDGQLISADILR